MYRGCRINAATESFYFKPREEQDSVRAT